MPSGKRYSYDTAAPMLGPEGGRQYGSRDGAAQMAAVSGDFPTAPFCDPSMTTGGGSGGHRKVTTTHHQGDAGRRDRPSMILFERASRHWWNLRFASKALEKLYLRLYSFPQIRRSFRFGLIYAIMTTIVWVTFHLIISDFYLSVIYHSSAAALICLFVLILYFTCHDRLYQKFYYSTGFLVIFLIIVVSLLFFCVNNPLISPLGTFVTSLQTILLLYVALPCPLYVVLGCGIAYSVLFEILTQQNLLFEYSGVKFALHMCFHLLGAHLFVLSQVRDRKTFIKIGQSLLVSQDLEKEKRFIDNMIESVMPRKVAEELLKGTIELRRPSAGVSARGSIFRPFTMNLMTNVSILFADIAGFTKMSSNKSADELVDLLNDLFGRFDKICTNTGCEKISTLGDCYYCVSGCPEPRPDHAKCCVEMGLSMCVAIKDFDADRNQDVNMRVGIHTGTVMCGIVGTKRFKFDVFSNDVNLANTMESTGRAGWVHISQDTKPFLGTDYTLEEGETYNGMKTYFVIGRARALTSSSSHKSTGGGAIAAAANHSSSNRPNSKSTTNTPLMTMNTSTSAVPMTSSTGGTMTSSAGEMMTSSPGARGGAAAAMTSSAPPPMTSSSVGESASFVEKFKDDLRHIDSSEIEYEMESMPPSATHHETAKLTGSLPFSEAKKSHSLAILSPSQGARPSPALNAPLSANHKNASLPGGGGRKAPPHPPQNTNSPFIAGSTNGNRAAAIGGGINEQSTNSDQEEEEGEVFDDATNGNRVRAATRESSDRLSINKHLSPNKSSSMAAADEESRFLTGLEGSGSARYGSASGKVDFMAHATSITRFDTAHMDFDQRLVSCIENSYSKIRQDRSAINMWTLKFCDEKMEREYQRHFSADFTNSKTEDDDENLKIDDTFRVTSPKYSVFLDVLISSAAYLIVCGVTFGVFGIDSTWWIVYFVLSFIILLLFISLTVHRLVKCHALPLALTHWFWRHAIGLLLINLPLGAAYCNILCILNADSAPVTMTSSVDSTTAPPTVFLEQTLPNPLNTAHHLIIIYIYFVVMFLHVNFSQLNYLIKSISSFAIGLLTFVLIYSCICACANSTPDYTVSALGANSAPNVAAAAASTLNANSASSANLAPNAASALSANSPPDSNFYHWQQQQQFIAAVNFLAQMYRKGVRPLDPRPAPLPLVQNWTFLNENFDIFSRVVDNNVFASVGQSPSATIGKSPLLNNTNTLYVRKYLFHPAVFHGIPVYRCEIFLHLLLALILIVYINHQFEFNFRMSYYGDRNAYRTIQEMSSMKYQADWLLNNIIPHHIQDQLMKFSKYSENHEMVAVVFASIVNWHEMYEETYEGGREFLRVLNELVADFDELLDRSEFLQVEKIKTIGTTYMAASGLNAGRRRLSVHPYSHLYELMEFALALQESLENFNKDLLNFDFKMKIGYNIGPITAGVIGTTKLYYDIWGDTVNIASRMYSNGVVGRVQVSRKARDMLQDVYDFEYRDHIEVKGIDGGMEVYLLKGRKESMQPRSRLVEQKLILDAA